MKPHWIIIALLGLMPASLAWAQTTASGTVYWDKNQNGQRDSADAGLPGVAVSNGREVVLTNEEGKYSLEIDAEEDNIFVVKPSGYRLPADELNRPRFYYLHRPEGSPELEYEGVKPTGPLPEAVNFPLIKASNDRSFRVLLLADPQPANREEVNYFDQDIVSELRGADGFAFGLTLGDMVDGRLDLFEPYSRAVAKIGIPWFHVHGNNDKNASAEKGRHSDETYEANFGPSTYAFNYGDTHFIVLDNVDHPRPNTLAGFTGGLTDEQLAFIQNDLEHVSPDKLVVLAFHIPLFGSFPDRDRRELFELLEKYPNTLSLAGHTHEQQFRFFDAEDGWKRLKPHMHFNVGSASGLRWSGVPDERGIPPAVMRDGTPNGYAILNIEGSSFTIDYKAANKPADYRMRIWGPKVVPKDTPHYAQLYVNYFLGNSYTDLEFRLKGSDSWRPMRRVEEADPHLTAVRTKWDRAEEVPEGFRPLNPVESTHLWTGFVPNNLPAGEHTLEIRVSDLFGRTFIDEFTYRVVAAGER